MSERDAVISGIGQSDVGRRLYRNPLDLTLDACLDAIDDAGLTRDDIDGIATYPGNMDTPPGFSGVGVTEVHDALRLNLNWFAGGLEAPGPARLGHQRVPGGGGGPGQPRAVLPHGVGGHGAGHRRTRRHRCGWRRRQPPLRGRGSCSGRSRTARRRRPTGSR